MKQLILPPIKESSDDFEEIEKELSELFKREIYYPLLAELGAPKKSLKNAIDDLLEAIMSGRVIYYRGQFTGRWTAAVSRELRRIGAKWDRTQGSWKIPRSALSVEVRNAISLTARRNLEKIQKIDTKLSKILPEEIADHVKVEKAFSKALWKVEKKISDQLKSYTIQPKFTPEQRERIAKEYQDNMKLYIQDWTQKEIKTLREQIQAHTLKGYRYEDMVKTIQKSYGSSHAKAKFLARQETNLYITKLKQIRYQDAGVNDYIWGCVVASPDHPVRPMHKKLEGKTFSWNNPPITDEDGRRNHPGQDFNCVPEDSCVLLHSPAKKLFRRWYDGKLTEIISGPGKPLRVTPNHPVLTRRGWVAAHLVKVGDYLVEAPLESLNGVIGDPKSGNIMTAKEIFSSFLKSGSLNRIAGATSWFHGDASGENVDIIRTDRMLMNKLNSKFFEQINQKVLSIANFLTFGNGKLMGRLITMRCSTYRVASSFCPLFLLIKGGLIHSIKHGLASVSYPNIIGFKNSPNWSSSDVKFMSDSLLADAINIHPDNFIFRKVESVVSKPWSGYVHNFETITGWYSASNLIVHNCRCFARPIVRFNK